MVAVGLVKVRNMTSSRPEQQVPQGLKCPNHPSVACIALLMPQFTNWNGLCHDHRNDLGGLHAVDVSRHDMVEV